MTEKTNSSRSKPALVRAHRARSKHGVPPRVLSAANRQVLTLALMAILLFVAAATLYSFLHR
ncbi:hypothetical protein [Rhizobium tubonense]|uniref:hypothetical protein n=1 Tax=Rhizobium tubonense TaxID=484088 RepID=UPI0011B7691D|nr:hypothetical protein [Rhizobium tubonense]